jgi:hypothetical protein
MRNDRAAASLVAAGLVLTACTGPIGGASFGMCRTSVDMLAALRPGMSYRQVAQVVGCDATTNNRTVDGSQTTVAMWSGPGSSSFSATLVTFRDDRMISFAVNGQ